MGRSTFLGDASGLSSASRPTARITPSGQSHRARAARSAPRRLSRRGTPPRPPLLMSAMPDRQRPRKRASASSTARSSAVLSRPPTVRGAEGSTTVVCSTRTRVSRPSIAIVGRKLAGRALAEVGETIVVLRPRELVGLHDHCMARAALLMPAGAARGRQAEHLASDHVNPAAAPARPSARGSPASPRGRRRRSPIEPPRRGSPSGLAGVRRPRAGPCAPPRVGHATGSHDVQRGGGRVIEADVQGSHHVRSVARNMLQGRVRDAHRVRSGGAARVDVRRRRSCPPCARN